MPVLQISKSITEDYRSPAQKSLELAQQYGYLCPIDLMVDYAHESNVPAICSDCEYSTEYEPDQSNGYCEYCGTNTVKSILILQGVI
tara:strand:- start:97 stop:357 length:261 start_codon:yes stop_codon:yes gene_type:complete